MAEPGLRGTEVDQHLEMKTQGIQRSYSIEVKQIYNISIIVGRFSCITSYLFRIKNYKIDRKLFEEQLLRQLSSQLSSCCNYATVLTLLVYSTPLLL